MTNIIATSGLPDAQRLPDLFLLFQLSDSAFPSGGFAHSGGLEAAWQLGAVRGREALEHYVSDSLEQCGQAVLPFVSAAHQQPERFGELDEWFNATLLNHVANRASRALGMGFLSTCVTAFPRVELTELKHCIRHQPYPGHLATITGTVCAYLGLARRDCQQLFVFQHLRTLMSTAVRLGCVGPLEAQAIHQRLNTFACDIIARYHDHDIAMAAASAPLHDLFQGHHDRLYSRLFMS